MPLTLRPLTPADCDLVCRQREDMFRSAGHKEEALAAMAEPYRTWQRERLEDGSYFGFIAEAAGQPVGGIGLMEVDFPPHPLHPAKASRGYVLNLFVEPAWRGQGIATKLMAAAEEAFRARGLTYAMLHATKQARPMYEQHGWSQIPELGKPLSLA